MKKMKFTLGLALSMMILGASVVNAQFPTEGTLGFYDHTQSKGSDAILITASLKGCNYYSANVTISQVFVLPNFDFINPTYPTIGVFPIINFTRPDINIEDSIFDSGIAAWGYGGFKWNSTNNYYEWTSVVGGDLFFLQHMNAQAYHEISIQLAYTVGNDLRPVVRRHVIFADVNHIEPNPPTALYEASRTFHPVEDRATGYIDFVFQDDMIALVNKHPVAAIWYEITINDEYGTPGETYYDPPTAADVVMQYALQLLPEEGITTDPATLDGMPIYVQGQKDFTFNVTCPSKPTVTTDPVRRDNWKQIIEPIVVPNGDGTWAVTIQHVNKPMKVYLFVENAEIESGETANMTILTDALWASSGSLIVQAVKPSTLSIYTVTGQLYKQMPVSGNISLPLPKGLYIVQLNGKAYKIIN